MLSEFKQFIFKGNVVDLSTGVLIGAAFGKIVSAFTDGIVNPVLKFFGGGPNVSGLAFKIGEFKDDKGVVLPNNIDLGLIVNAAIGFLITAAVIFFVIVKPMNKAMALMNKPAPAAAPPEPPADVKLLTEIRDLLKK